MQTANFSPKCSVFICMGMWVWKTDGVIHTQHMSLWNNWIIQTGDKLSKKTTCSVFSKVLVYLKLTGQLQYTKDELRCFQIVLTPRVCSWLRNAV